MRTHFEKARVCVLRRVPRPVSLEPWAEEATQNGEIPITIDLPVEFDYEVVAWPPGTVDGGMLPQVGDEISLPGYETPFRVVERALHWPAPSSTEGRTGELQVNLAVEAVGANALNSPPWGRPGTDNGNDRRWLEAEIVSFETMNSRVTGREYMAIGFNIDGIGILVYRVTFVWQAIRLLGTVQGDQGPQDFADQAELTANLAPGQRFEVEVGPRQWKGVERLEIHDVRRPSQPEPEDEPNRWAAEANEVTDTAWGQL